MACPLASIPFLPGDSLRVMSHSQPHGCFRGLSREEKHLPDSRIPQLRETTALDGVMSGLAGGPRGAARMEQH